MKWEKIICPVDFSKISLEALKIAEDIVRECGGKLYLVHILEPILAPTDFTFGPLTMSDVEEKLSEKALEGLKDLAKNLSISPEKVEIKVGKGIASQEIVKFAEEIKADLIVMGTHGYTGLTHALLGSTAERVVRRAPCPVLTLKGSEERTE